MSDVFFTNNVAINGGIIYNYKKNLGGIYIASDSVINIISSNFNNNKADIGGGK